MKIWKLRLDAGKREDSQQYQLVNDDNHFLEDFDTMINSLERQLWKLRELEVHVISGRKEFDISYLWNGTSLFLLNERAKNILEPVLSEYVEFLPVIYKKPLYLMHVLRVADALDLDNAIRSKKASYSRIYGAQDAPFIRNKEQFLISYIIADTYAGKIGYIKKFAFKEERIPPFPIFRILCEGRLYTGVIFIKDEFKKIIEENGLTGFSFEEVGEYQ